MSDVRNTFGPNDVMTEAEAREYEAELSPIEHRRLAHARFVQNDRDVREQSVRRLIYRIRVETGNTPVVAGPRPVRPRAGAHMDRVPFEAICTIDLWGLRRVVELVQEYAKETRILHGGFVPSPALVPIGDDAAVKAMREAEGCPAHRCPECSHLAHPCTGANRAIQNANYCDKCAWLAFTAGQKAEMEVGRG